MKIKYILAALVVVGMIFFIRGIKKKNNTKNCHDNFETNHDNQESRQPIIENLENTRETYKTINDSIKNRHLEASKQIRESLNNIVNDEIVKNTTNTNTLNDVLDDIDNLK